MVDELLNILAMELASAPVAGGCPHPLRLSATAQGASAGIDVAELARHLANCMACARRWELLQLDRCISAGEAFAITRLNTDDFVRVRAESHARQCSRCSKILSALGKFDRFATGLSGSGGLVLPVQLLELTLTRGPAPMISAAILESDGSPRIAGDQIFQQRMSVLESSVRDGFLSVRLAAGTGFSTANLAIFPVAEKECGAALLLPSVRVVDGIASWHIPAASQEGIVPAISLAVTLVSRPAA
jgi:hypothetical protein